MAELRQELMLEVAADSSLLCAVRGMVRAYVVDAGFGEEKVSEIILGVDEACTNVIRHAYHNDRNRKYRMLFFTSDDMFEIHVEDDGRCAEEEMFLGVREVDPDEDTVTPGGLGVRLIRRVFDEVEYVPGTNTGNCTIMRLKRPAT